MRDTSVDFPSSTLSSKDSGRSTMSSSKKSPEKNSSLEKEKEGPELRHRAGGGAAAARPITITASSFFPTVPSAPNLASLNSSNGGRLLHDGRHEGRCDESNKAMSHMWLQVCGDHVRGSPALLVCLYT